MVNDYIKSSYGLFINGEFVDSKSKETLEVKNPATGEVLTKIAKATEKDVDKAVQAAKETFKTWRYTSVNARADYLLEIASKIMEHKDEIATIETLNNGKPIRETSMLDIPLAADHFKYFAGVIRAEEGTVTNIDHQTMSIIRYEPIGVVGAVVAWNFPLLLASWKLAPALAAGNTIVIQPSSSTPLSLLRVAEIFQEVLPPGVVNILTGKGSESGNAIFNHKDVAKLSFTGSTEVGYSAAEAGAKRLVPATLELGGKSANIIFDDADIEQAVEGVQLGILFNQGEVCSAGSRLFVQSSIYDDFLTKLKAAFEKIKVGDPMNQDTQMGSQTGPDQIEKIESYIQFAKDEGLNIITGGERVTENGLDKGHFFQPTIIELPSNDNKIAQEEIFGPVVGVLKFDSEEDVIAMANDSEYGLAGGIFTTNIYRALNVANRIDTGRIWVNTYNQFPAGTPFGGYKKSEIGRETFKDTIRNYQQVKNIYLDLSGKTKGFY